jgi:hypothetical protein
MNAAKAIAACSSKVAGLVVLNNGAVRPCGSPCGVLQKLVPAHEHDWDLLLSQLSSVRFCKGGHQCLHRSKAGQGQGLLVHAGAGDSHYTNKEEGDEKRTRGLVRWQHNGTRLNQFFRFLVPSLFRFKIAWSDLLNVLYYLCMHDWQPSSRSYGEYCILVLLCSLHVAATFSPGFCFAQGNLPLIISAPKIPRVSWRTNRIKLWKSDKGGEKQERLRLPYLADAFFLSFLRYQFWASSTKWKLLHSTFTVSYSTIFWAFFWTMNLLSFCIQLLQYICNISLGF